jgi:Anti-sigma-K factor rskA
MSADVRPERTGDDPPGDAIFLEHLTGQLDRHADRARIPSPPGSADPGRVLAPGAAETASTFDAIVDGLRAESTWSEPPVSLRDLILNRVREEAATGVEILAAPASVAVPQPVQEPPLPQPVVDVVVPKPVAPAPPTPSPRAGWWRPRWQRLAWAVPAAGLAAAIFTAGVLVTQRALAPDEPAGERFTATGTSLAVGATATVTISPSGAGFMVVVDATGLPAAAPGSYYAAWLHGPRGVVPLGSFHEHQTGGPVRLWSGVDPAGYATFVVTLQAEGEPPTPSNLVVMTATLS